MKQRIILNDKSKKNNNDLKLNDLEINKRK